MQLLREDYSLTFPPLSIARYSFIQLLQTNNIRKISIQKIKEVLQQLIPEEIREANNDIIIIIPWWDQPDGMPVARNGLASSCLLVPDLWRRETVLALT